MWTRPARTARIRGREMGGYFFALSSGVDRPGGLRRRLAGPRSVRRACQLAVVRGLGHARRSAARLPASPRLQNRALVSAASPKTRRSRSRATPRSTACGLARSVQFTAQIDKKGAIKKPIEEIEIFSGQGKGDAGTVRARRRGGRRQAHSQCRRRIVSRPRQAGLRARMASWSSRRWPQDFGQAVATK